MNDVEGWVAKLVGCDFNMAMNDVANTMSMLQKDGEVQGGNYYFSPEFASVLKDFYAKPDISTATALLEVSPSFLPMFEMNSSQDPLFNILKRLRQAREAESNS